MSGTEMAGSDADLAERVRAGDTRAFATLWQRHYRPAYRAAMQFSATVDPEDLLSEAYLRLYQQLLAGGGPRTAFRPYLYATIRNIATTQLTRASLPTDPLDEDPIDRRGDDDPAVAALDRSLTTRAYRSLPERWQTVLWYTEVEGMDPHEVAPMLGLSPNGVASLAYRAREGLRQAWLQAHVSDEGLTDDCRWAIARLGSHARDALGPRDRERLRQHLDGCTRCVIVSSEVEEVGSRLALVMMPMLLGGVAGVGLLEALTRPETIDSAVAELVMPTLPQATDAVTQVDAMALPLLGTVSLALNTGRRARIIGVIGIVILAGSLALGLARTASEPPPAPTPTSSFAP